MPFCTECKYEYESDVMTCPDCGVALVEELPQEKAQEAPEPMVPCWHTEEYVLADVACSALRSSGIRCEVLKSGRPEYKAYTMDAYPATYYVIVPESRQEEAVNIVREAMESPDK